MFNVLNSTSQFLEFIEFIGFIALLSSLSLLSYWVTWSTHSHWSINRKAKDVYWVIEFLVFIEVFNLKLKTYNLKLSFADSPVHRFTYSPNNQFTDERLGENRHIEAELTETKKELRGQIYRSIIHFFEALKEE